MRSIRLVLVGFNRLAGRKPHVADAALRRRRSPSSCRCTTRRGASRRRCATCWRWIIRTASCSSSSSATAARMIRWNARVPRATAWSTRSACRRAPARPRDSTRDSNARPARSSCSPTRASCSSRRRCAGWSRTSRIQRSAASPARTTSKARQTEGFYGRLELLLRREEARLHSIAGASGCFYAQRRDTCKRFVAGMAPDFLSVLVTVTAGHRALAEPAARGSMTATSSQRAEFTRKVRTFLRGITALFGNAASAEPVRAIPLSVSSSGRTSCCAGSRRCRWSVRWSHRGCCGNMLSISSPSSRRSSATRSRWRASFGRALAARVTLVRLAAFFVLVNAAAFKALLLWISGSRLEVWEPTRRPG